MERRWKSEADLPGGAGAEVLDDDAVVGLLRVAGPSPVLLPVQVGAVGRPPGELQPDLPHQPLSFQGEEGEGRGGRKGHPLSEELLPVEVVDGVVGIPEVVKLHEAVAVLDDHLADHDGDDPSVAANGMQCRSCEEDCAYLAELAVAPEEVLDVPLVDAVGESLHVHLRTRHPRRCLASLIPASVFPPPVSRRCRFAQPALLSALSNRPMPGPSVCASGSECVHMGLGAC